MLQQAICTIPLCNTCASTGNLHKAIHDQEKVLKALEGGEALSRRPDRHEGQERHSKKQKQGREDSAAGGVLGPSSAAGRDGAGEGQGGGGGDGAGLTNECSSA